MRRYLTFIIAGFIIYNLIENTDLKNVSNLFKQQEVASKDQVSLPTNQLTNQPTFEGSWLERKIAGVVTNIVKTPEGKAFIQNLIQPMNKMPPEQYNLKLAKHEIIDKLFNAKIIQAGYGERTVCGSKVIVEYSLYDMADNLIAQHDQQIINLGSGTTDIAIENAVINMQVNELKTVIVSPYLLVNSKLRENTKIQLSLKKILASPYAKNIKFFDDNLSIAKPILCGEKIEFDLEIADINGKMIYSNSKLTSQVGKLNAPPVITIGLYGKILESTRTVIINGDGIINANYSYRNLNPSLIKSNHMYLATFKNTKYAPKF